jgi:MoxR-like ATPase
MKTVKKDTNMTIKLTPRKKLFVEAAAEMFGNGSIVTKDEIRNAAKKAGVPYPTWMSRAKVGYNKHKLPDLDVPAFMDTAAAKGYVPDMQVANLLPCNEPDMVMNLIASNLDKQNLVPAPFVGFVPWGNYGNLKKIVKSGMFYPVFITGLSGNGKTLMVEQLHAELGKELIRLNITIETDEDDLLGGFRLVNGETKFVPGPVIEAMERGCTLLLDECDLGSNKLLALQPVLEGKGVFLKKVNKWITAKPGFNVMATANTKGKGSEDGRFIGTNILNEAFLERFAITIEQPYPTAAIEKKIVMGSMKKYGEVDEEFATNLVTWAEVIRKTFYDGGVDEIISTRRLDHIVKAFTIFKDKMTSIEMCVARFDDDTKESFLDLYTKVDAGVMVSEDEVSEEKKELENAF